MSETELCESECRMSCVARGCGSFVRVAACAAVRGIWGRIVLPACTPPSSHGKSDVTAEPSARGTLT